MHDRLFSHVVSVSYTRSGLLRRAGVLKEFLEFVFFTKHADHAERGLAAAFADTAQLAQDERHFLMELPEDVLKAFGRDTFYQDINGITKRAEELRTVGLTVPVSFEREQVESIGSWIRRNVGEQTLLELEVDPSIAVGCRIAWNNTLHDFSLEHYLAEHETDVHTALQKVLAPKET